MMVAVTRPTRTPAIVFGRDFGDGQRGRRAGERQTSVSFSPSAESTSAMICVS